MTREASSLIDTMTNGDDRAMLATEPTTGWTSARRRRVAIWLCIVAVLGFYLRCAWTYGKDLDPAPTRGDFQNLQADAFLAGQLNLRIATPDGLVALPDPFDAAANAPYRNAGLHDLSYRDGKLYTYFGPAPVLLLYVPYRLLHVGALSPTLACLIFCSGGFLASVALFRLLTRRFLAPLPLFTEAVAIVALGLAAPMGWQVSIGRAYEVANACAYFMVFTGLYFLCAGLFKDRSPSWPHLALGSLFVAGAIGSRPNMFFALVFVGYALIHVIARRRESDASSPVAFAALVVPVVFMGVLLAWYNWARFGSMTEFGTNYQLLGENVRLARANELGFLRTGLFEYLLSPARTRDDFPWMALRAAKFGTPSELSYLREPVAGIFTNMPACFLGILTFFAVPIARMREKLSLSALILLLTGAGLAVVSLNSYRVHGATMRYQLDYAPMFLMASVLGWAVFSQRMQKSTAVYLVLQSCAVLVIAWSAFFSVAITTYPCAGTGSC